MLKETWLGTFFFFWSPVINKQKTNLDRAAEALDGRTVLVRGQPGEGDIVIDELRVVDEHAGDVAVDVARVMYLHGDFARIWQLAARVRHGTRLVEQVLVLGVEETLEGRAAPAPVRVEHIVARAVHHAIRIVVVTVWLAVGKGTVVLGRRVLRQHRLALLVALVAVHVEEGASGAEWHLRQPIDLSRVRVTTGRERPRRALVSSSKNNLILSMINYKNAKLTTYHSGDWRCLLQLVLLALTSLACSTSSPRSRIFSEWPPPRLLSGWGWERRALLHRPARQHSWWVLSQRFLD